MGFDSSSRRRPLRDLDGGGDGDIEEGEYVPEAPESDDSGAGGDEELRRLQRRLEGELGRRVSWLEVVMASGRVAVPPRLAPPSSESDGTISDGGRSPSAVSSSVMISAAGAPAPRFACHVCGRRFHSPKAVDGHMRVHVNGRQQVPLAVSGGWAATGRRGWTGGGKPSVSASLNSESTDNHSTATVAEPIPMAIAMPATPVVSTGTNLSGEESSSASAQPMHYELPVATVVTVANPSSTGVVIHQHAAPPPAAAAGQARPVHQVAAPLPAARQAQLVRRGPLAPPRAARPAPQPAREYSCKLCGKSYSSHQGLGGHAAGHKNRQKEAEAAAAAAMMGQEDGGAFLAAFRRGSRAAQPPHECRKCHKVFPTGVALGGHMRMHYTGPPIVHRKNKKQRGLVSEADLRLALSTATEAPPQPAAAVAGRVRLFGIDIGSQVQAPPPEDQGSGTAEGSSSAGEQD